jgi:cytochrome c1
MNSVKRDFSDVFQTFDPRNPTGRDQFVELNKIGTPISSRLIASERLSSAIESQPKSDIEISNEIEIVENDKNRQVHSDSNGIKDDVDSKTIENGNALKIIEDDDDDIPEKREEERQTEATDVKHDEIPKKLRRSDSASSEISVPGTPVSSRDLRTLRNRNFIDTDDSGSEDEDGNVANDSIEIKTLAQEFVAEIENLVQKSFDDDRQEIALEELKKITTQNVDSGETEKPPAAEGESDEKLIIHEEQLNDSNPDGLVNKVEAYFEKSEKENTYTRTFSEVENFNRVSDEVKQKVENYFKESEEKKSLTRPFSQVVNYVEPKVDLNQLLKPGTPVSSATVECLKKKNQRKSIDSDPEVLKGQEALRKAQDALQIDKKEFVVDDYFKQSQERQTYQRNFSEVLDQLNKEQSGKNPEIEKYFEESDAKSSFQRPFSQVIQSVAPRVDEIMKEEERPENKNAPLHYQRSSRASSISSNCSDLSESENPRKTKKHGKKYGIDKYFATSLYRTAYHRSNSRRTSRDGENFNEELKILEDEDVFGETDLLRQQTFQHDDETAVTRGPNDVNENQSVQFWRDFLKPYNLNLQTEITITKDELLNNRTLE